MGKEEKSEGDRDGDCARDRESLEILEKRQASKTQRNQFCGSPLAVHRRLLMEMFTEMYGRLVFFMARFLIFRQCPLILMSNLERGDETET